MNRKCGLIQENSLGIHEDETKNYYTIIVEVKFNFLNWVRLFEGDRRVILSEHKHKKYLL